MARGLGLPGETWLGPFRDLRNDLFKCDWGPLGHSLQCVTCMKDSLSVRLISSGVCAKKCTAERKPAFAVVEAYRGVTLPTQRILTSGNMKCLISSMLILWFYLNYEGVHAT